MPLIRSFSIDTDRQHPFPFNIPAVKFARNVMLGERVTIFVGDNGSGKSTLLETIALSLDLMTIGGRIGAAESYDAARALIPFLDITWAHEVRKGFFFRAEDFSDFLKAVVRRRENLDIVLHELKGNVDPYTIKEMSESMNSAMRHSQKLYGDDLQAYSHGEAYFKILQTRINGKGVYLLDEPEAALSPLKQLSLIAFIMETLKDPNAQFILATHSPILMGIPGALLYEIQEDGMTAVGYEDTDHYRITKNFLDNPQAYLRHFR